MAKYHKAPSPQQDSAGASPKPRHPRREKGEGGGFGENPQLTEQFPEENGNWRQLNRGEMKVSIRRNGKLSVWLSSILEKSHFCAPEAVD